MQFNSFQLFRFVAWVAFVCSCFVLPTYNAAFCFWLGFAALISPLAIWGVQWGTRNSLYLIAVMNLVPFAIGILQLMNQGGTAYTTLLGDVIGFGGFLLNCAVALAPDAKDSPRRRRLFEVSIPSFSGSLFVLCGTYLSLGNPKSALTVGQCVFTFIAVCFGAAWGWYMLTIRKSESGLG